MARGLLEFLTKDDIRIIQRTSLRVLEKVGVIVHSEHAHRTLIDSGAKVSKENGRILIPQDMVKRALANAPKSVLLASRDGKNDIRIPSPDRVFASSGGEGVYVKDMLTGEMRPS